MEQICDLLLPLSAMEPGDDLLLVLIYNLVLFSGVQQSDFSYIHLLFQTIFHYRLF